MRVQITFSRAVIVLVLTRRRILSSVSFWHSRDITILLHICVAHLVTNLLQQVSTKAVRTAFCNKSLVYNLGVRTSSANTTDLVHVVYKLLGEYKLEKFSFWVLLYTCLNHFLEDYRITSACNILKLLIKNANDQSTCTIQSTVKTKSSISLRATIDSRTQRSPSCSGRSQRSRSSLSSGERRSMIGQVSSRAILLALRACRQFIMCRNNEDIDGQYEVMHNMF